MIIAIVIGHKIRMPQPKDHCQWFRKVALGFVFSFGIQVVWKWLSFASAVNNNDKSTCHRQYICIFETFVKPWSRTQIHTRKCSVHQSGQYLHFHRLNDRDVSGFLWRNGILEGTLGWSSGHGSELVGGSASKYSKRCRVGSISIYASLNSVLGGWILFFRNLSLHGHPGPRALKKNESH